MPNDYDTRDRDGYDEPGGSIYDDDDAYDHRPPVECADETRTVGTVVMETINTNRNCRQYHFRTPILGHCIWKRQYGFNEPNDAGDVKAITALTEVAGLTCLLLTDAYCLWISKAASFTWEEVEGVIFDILNSHDEEGRANVDTQGRNG